MFKKIRARFYFYRFSKAHKNLLFNKAMAKASKIEIEYYVEASKIEMDYYAELFLWESLLT